MKTLTSLGVCAGVSALVAACTLDQHVWYAMGLSMGLGLVSLALVDLLFTFLD